MRLHFVIIFFFFSHEIFHVTEKIEKNRENRRGDRTKSITIRHVRPDGLRDGRCRMSQGRPHNFPLPNDSCLEKINSLILYKYELYILFSSSINLFLNSFLISPTTQLNYKQNQTLSLDLSLSLSNHHPPFPNLLFHPSICISLTLVNRRRN